MRKDKNSRKEEKERAVERRRHKRLYFDIKARLILDETTYEGYIGNVSESGIGYLITSSVMLREDVPPYQVIDVSFDTPDGKHIALQCEVRWAKKGLFSGKTTSVGMKIIDPPQEYVQWLKDQTEGSMPDRSVAPDDQG